MSCAWCNDVPEQAPRHDAQAPASHGICPSCLATQLAALQAAPASLPAGPAPTPLLS